MFCSDFLSHALGSLTGAPDKVIQRVNPTTKCLPRISRKSWTIPPMLECLNWLNGTSQNDWSFFLATEKVHDKKWPVDLKKSGQRTRDEETAVGFFFDFRIQWCYNGTVASCMSSTYCKDILTWPMILLVSSSLSFGFKFLGHPGAPGTSSSTFMSRPVFKRRIHWWNNDMEADHQHLENVHSKPPVLDSIQIHWMSM